VVRRTAFLTKSVTKNYKIAKELSDLIIYCRSVRFDENNFAVKENRNCLEMSSFSESDAVKMTDKNKCGTLLEYNHLQISRVYPKGNRINSSNYSPLPFWNCGCQMAALNFQTPDIAMQLNDARFVVNDNCGYVLKPMKMRVQNFHPYNPTDRVNMKIDVEVLGGRHLPKTGNQITCPLVEVEICGCDYDNKTYRTKKIDGNGFGPIWDGEQFTFDVFSPETSFIRFSVLEDDYFKDTKFLCHATFPVTHLRTGYRSVPLKNTYSEAIPLASLLVHISIQEYYPLSIMSTQDNK